jgi:hypothetical protein
MTTDDTHVSGSGLAAGQQPGAGGRCVLLGRRVRRGECVRGDPLVAACVLWQRSGGCWVHVWLCTGSCIPAHAHMPAAVDANWVHWVRFKSVGAVWPHLSAAAAPRADADAAAAVAVSCSPCLQAHRA